MTRAPPGAPPLPSLTSHRHGPSEAWWRKWPRRRLLFHFLLLQQQRAPRDHLQAARGLCPAGHGTSSAHAGLRRARWDVLRAGGESLCTQYLLSFPPLLSPIPPPLPFPPFFFSFSPSSSFFPCSFFILLLLFLLHFLKLLLLLRLPATHVASRCLQP